MRFGRRTLSLGVLFLVSACTERAGPFAGAFLYVDAEERFHLFLVAPPWELVDEAPEQVDFAAFTEGPFGILPQEIPVAGLAIFPPAAVAGGLDGAVAARRAVLAEDPRNVFQREVEPFVNDDGDPGAEFSYLEQSERGDFFHREFFFATPTGEVAGLFYVGFRRLDLPEVEAMTRTFSFGGVVPEGQ